LARSQAGGVPERGIEKIQVGPQYEDNQDLEIVRRMN
jgi:hypothetical protein